MAGLALNKLLQQLAIEFNDYTNVLFKVVISLTEKNTKCRVNIKNKNNICFVFGMIDMSSGFNKIFIGFKIETSVASY